MASKSEDISDGVTWVVVAAASRADIYSRQKRFSDLEIVQSLTEPDARAKESDLTSDAPGSTFDSGGQGRHSMEPKRTGKQHLRDTFARQVADAIESGHQGDRFRHLVLVAAPAMLGELRRHLSKTTLSQVVRTVDKNVTSETSAEIAALLDSLDQ
jgi:protein required for attachment to host cells